MLGSGGDEEHKGDTDLTWFGQSAYVHGGGALYYINNTNYNLQSLNSLSGLTHTKSSLLYNSSQPHHTLVIPRGTNLCSFPGTPYWVFTLSETPLHGWAYFALSMHCYL